MIGARNPQRILGCPICGYRVDTKDRTCPRCGSEFATGTKFECPLCGGLVDANARSCPSCHVDYNDFRERTIARGNDDEIDSLLTEIIGIESAQVKQENKRYSCPDCSWMLDGSESVCPRCNHDLVADLSFQCPMCGAIVGSSAKACPECGVSFEEAEVLPETPAAQPEPVERMPAPVQEPVKAPEPPASKPEPEKPVEAKPIVVVKRPPAVVAKPPEPKQKEPEPAEHIKAHEELEVELAKPEPAPAEQEAETLHNLDHIEEDAQAAGTTAQPAKKRRKLKAKPKG